MTEERTSRRPPDRWRARPVISAALRLLILLVPVAVGVGAGVTISRVIPPPQGPARIGWWVLLLTVSGLCTEVTARLARRLLPLTVLLKLTLIFPDRAPSRLGMARRVGSTRNLEACLRHAREHGVDDDPARAAETILQLVAALSTHDRRTRGHAERVRALTDILADALGLPEESRDRLRWAALLHDIGKLEVPERILNKAGKPDQHEWETLRGHPAEGARLAAPLLPWLDEWGLAIEQHHERFDGHGYPYGKSGARLSYGARILAVTDSFETMTAARAYRRAMSPSAARQELAAMAGAQFDPAVVRTFLSVSLGRLWWITGPMSWLAQLPLVAPATQATRVVGAAATKVAVGVAAVGVGGGLVGPRDQATNGDRASTTAEAVQVSQVAAPGGARRDAPPGKDRDEGPPHQAGGGPAESPQGSEPGGQEPPGGADEGSGGQDGSDDEGAGSGSGSGSGIQGGGGETGSGGGSGVIGGVTGTVTDTVDEVTDTVGDAVDGLGQTVDDTADDLLDSADDLLGGVGDGLGL